MSTAQKTRSVSGALAPGEWIVDPARSSVGFSLKHLLFKTVHGHFSDFSGVLVAGERGLHGSGTVEVASVDTGDAIRDGHLRDSADFFGLEGHPQISFDSTDVELGGGGRARLRGELELRGIRRAVEMSGDWRLAGKGADERVELRLRGEVERQDFGITWNQTLDTGGAMLGNRVKLELRIVAARAQGA